jgi:hypothetical protein
MNLYARNKLSIKLNMVMSQGKKSEGVVADKAIDSIMKSFDGYGLYEIVWDNAMLFPIGMSKLSNKYEVHKSGTNYVLTFDGKYEKVLFWSQIIKFDIQEWRNNQLKKVLEDM